MKIHAHTSALFVGIAGRVEIEIVADKETRIDYVDARIQSVQGWSIGSGRSQISHRHVERYVETRLRGKGVLPVGTTRLALDVTLPPGTPPWHAIEPAYAYVELRVHVSIPWWPDPRERFRLPVRLPPGPPVPPVPSVWRSLIGREDEPRIELGLASQRVAAGDTLVGSCAVYHMGDSKPRDVSVLLVPMFTLFGRGRARPHAGDAFGIRLVLPPGSDGTSMPFAIQLPASLTPSFAATSQVLEWQVHARTGGSLFGRKLLVIAPLYVVDAIAADVTTRYARPPALTDERVVAVLVAFAREHGWRQVTDDDARAFSIARAEGEHELRLSYVHRGADGTFLVARIAHASLGLGLSVVPSSTLRHVFLKDIEVDVPDWDRRHLVNARFAEQALPMLRAAVPGLVEAIALGTLVRWTDDALVFERPIVAISAPDLDFASRTLVRLAAGLVAACALIPPPPGCVVDVEAWRDLARTLHGHLALGDLSIAGTLGSAPIHLGLDFDGDAHPTAVHATLGDPEQAGAEARAVSLALARPAAEIAASGAPDAIAELVATWPADLVDLHVADGVVAASWRLPAAAPPVIDVTRVRQRVDALSAVLGALSPGASPYR